jgi:hypothetical protein
MRAARLAHHISSNFITVRLFQSKDGFACSTAPGIKPYRVVEVMLQLFAIWALVGGKMFEGLKASLNKLQIDGWMDGRTDGWINK